MDFCLKASILIATLAISLSLCSALPYPAWFEPGRAALDKQEPYPSDLNDSLQMLRRIMALQQMKDKLSQSIVNETGDDEANSRSKRLDFGFAGLDNMDHILSTLDRKEAMRTHPRANFFQNMKNQGYRGGNNMEKLTKMMVNVG